MIPGFAIAHPAKLRFENSTNKKTLKQAWRFFLLYYLFVTSTGFAIAHPAKLRFENQKPVLKNSSELDFTHGFSIYS